MLLVVACTNSNMPMTEAQKKAVTDQGVTVVKEFFTALETNDFEKITALLDTTGDYVMITGGERFDYSTGMKMMDQLLPAVDRQTFDTKFEKYVVLSPSCFQYTWEGENGIYMKSGESVIFDDYLVTYTFLKENGKWKLLNGHESFKIPTAIDSTLIAEK